MNYSRTASAVAVVAVLVTVPALVLGGAVVIGGESEPAAAPAVTGPGPGEAVPTAAATTEPGPGPASEAAALQCTNGTSGTVVACGYDPGPTTVALEHIESGGATATIRAVELESGGFVAVHTDGYLDGAFTGSVLGTSEYLGPGLHKNVTVELDRFPQFDKTILAVVYRDSDDDREFDFVATDGKADRPYTNTYDERRGTNVTDDPGKVIGDAAVVRSTTDRRVAKLAVPGDTVRVRTTVRVAEAADRVALSESFDPAFERGALESVRFQSGGGSVVTSDVGTENAVVEFTGVEAGSVITVTYTLTIPEDATLGTGFTIGGQVERSDVSRESLVEDTVTVAGVERYAGPDGTVSGAELQTAVRDWARGDISDRFLQNVIRAWAAG
jgi:hypothetical protein